MAFFRQLQLLLWKNGLGIFRRPIWSITLILWPIIIFIIIAVTRYQFPPILNPTCYVGPRNLPSTGFFPFLETLMCNTDSDCHNTSRLAHPKPSRSRRSQPSAESPLAKLIKGRDLKKFANTDMQNGPTELLNKMYNIFGTPSSGSMAAYNHTFSDETVLNLTQSAADLKLVVCTIGLPLVTNPPQDNTAAAFLTFCKSNNTVFEVGINTVDQILIELMRTQPEELAKLAEKAVKFINQLQNETSLWEIFIVLPHIFNPDSPEQLLVNLDILLTNLQRVLNIIEYNFPEVKNVTSSLHPFLVAGIRTIYYMQNWPGKAVSIRFGDVVTGNESLWQVVADIEIPLDQAIALAFDRNMVHDFVCKNISGPMWVAVCGTGSLDTVLSWISSDKLFQQIFLAWSKNDVAKHDFRFIEGMIHSLTGIFEGSRPTRPERNVETQPQNIGEELFLEVGKVVKEILRFMPEAEAVFQQILFVGFQSMKTGTQAIVTVEEIIENVVKDVTTVKMIAQTMSTSQPQTIIWISRALNSSSEIIWKIIAGHPVTLDTILDEFEWVFVFKTIKKDVVQSILCGNTTIIEQTLGKDWMPLIKNVQELFSVFMNQTTSNVSLPMVLSEWHNLLNKSLGFGGFLQKLEEDWTGEYWMDWISENTIASHLPASLQQSVLDFMVKFGHELEQSHFWPQAKSYFHLTLWILDFTDPALPNCTLNMDTLGHDCDANFDWYRFSHALTALLSPNEELLISYLKRSVRVLQHIYSDFYKNLAASSIKNAIKGGDMLSDFLINMLNQVDEFAHTLTTLPNQNFSNPQVMTSLYVNLLESIGLKPLVPLILQDGPFNVSQVLEVISKLGRSNQGIFTFNESDPTMAELEELIVNFLSLEGNVSFSFYISMSQTMLSYYSYFTPEDVAKLKQAIQPFTNQTSSGLAEAVLTCVELLETIMSGDPTQMTLGYIRQIQHFLVSLFRMQMIEQYELTGGHFIANVTNLQLLSDIFELLTPEMIMNLTHTGPEAALHLIIQKYVKTLPPHVRPEAANFLHAFVALQGELAQCASSQDCLTGTSEMLDLLDQILESTISANLNVTINIGSTKMYKEREHIIDVANAFFSLILQSTDAVYVKTVREILQFISMLLRQPNIDLDHIQEALKANLTTEELNNLVQWLGAKDVKDLLEKVAQLQAAQKCFEGTSPASIAHCAAGMVSSITGFLMHLPVLQSHKPIISMIPVIVNQTVTGMIDINFTSSPQGALEEALKVTLASVEQTLHRINMSNHEIQRELEVLKNIIKLVGNPAPLKHLNATQDEINSGEAPLKMILWYLERLENVTSRSSVSHLLYPYFRIAQIQVALQLSQMDLTQFIVDQVWYLSDSLEYPIDAKGVVKIANATATILEHVLKFVAESLEAQNAPSILFGYDTQINMTFVNTIMLQINNYVNVLEDWITEANINSWGNLNYSSMLQNDIYKLTQSTLDFFNVDHRGYIQAIRNLTLALDNVLMLALHPNGFQSKQFIYAIQEAVQSAMNLLIRINGPLPPVIQQSVLNLIGNAVGLAVHPEASYAMSLNATLHILHDLRVLINQIFPQEVTQYVMFPLEMITTYFESVSTLSGPDSFNQLILNEMETLESLLPPNSTAQLYISTIFNISKAILQPIKGNRTLHGPLEKRVSYIYTQVGDALNMLCPLFMSCERLNVSSLVGVSDLQHVLEKLLSGQDVFSDVFQIVQSVLRLFNVHQQGYMQAVGNLTQALDNALMFALQPNGLQSVQFSNALMRALQSLMDLLIQIDDPLTASSQHSLLNVIENAVWLAVHTEASFATSLNATLHLLQNVHLLTYQILPQEFAQYIAFPLKLIITYFETVASASGPDSVNQLILNEMETIESLLPPNSSEHHYVSTVFNITKAILQNVPGNGSLHGPLEQSIPYIYAEVGKLLNMLCPLFMSCKPLNTSSLEGFADLPHVLQKLMTGQASNETWRKLQEYFGVLLSFVEPEMSHADLACFVEMFEDVIETEVRKRKAEIGLILSLQTPVMGLITNFTHSLNGSHFNVSEVFERFEVAVEQTIKEIEKTNGTLSCQEVLNIWDPVREASGLNSSFMAMWCNVSLQPVIDAYVDDISQMSQNWTCTATGNVSAVAAASRIVGTLRSLYHAEFKHSDVIGLFVDALYTHFTVLVQQPLSPTAQHGLTMQLQRWQIQSSLRSLKLLSDQLENQFPTLKPYMDTVEKMVTHIVKNHQRMEESEEVFKEAAMILLSSLGVTTDDMNQILSGSFSSSSWVELVLDVMETVIDMNIFGDNPELYHTLNQLIASNDTTMVLHKVAEMIAWFASTEVKGVKFIVQTLTKMEELLGSLLKIFTNMDEDLSPSLHELQNLIRSAIAFIQQLLKSGSVPMGHHYSVSPGAMSSHNGSRVRHRRDAPFQPMNGIMDDVVDLFYIDYTTMFRALQVSPTPDEFLETAHVFFANPDLNLVLKESTKDLHSGINISREETIDAVLLVASLLTNPGTDYSSLDLWVQVVNMIPDDFPFVPLLKEVMQALARENHENLSLMQNTLNTVGVLFRIDPTDPQILRQLKQLNEQVCDLEQTSTIQTLEQGLSLENGILCDGIVPGVRILVEGLFFNMSRLLDDVFELFIGEPTMYHIQTNWTSAVTEGLGLNLTGLSSLNFTSHAAAVSIGDIVWNKTALEQDLERFGFHPDDVVLLTETVLPDNNLEIFSWLVHLRNCDSQHYNMTGGGEESLQNAFCSMDAEHWFGFTLLMAKHLNTEKFIIRMLLPREIQSLIQTMLRMTSSVIKMMVDLLPAMGQLEGYMSSFESLNFAANNEFRQTSRMQRTAMSSGATFVTISRALCSRGILALFGVAKNPHASVSPPSFDHHPKREEMIERFKIPRNATPFCTNMYLDMVNTTGGAIAWAFLKPMLMGKILFTPDTPQTRAIMNKANRTLAQLGDLRHYSQDWIQSSNSIVESAHMLTLTLPLLQNSLGNYFVRNFIEMQTGIDVDSMQETLNTFSNMTELVEKNKELLGQITTLSRLMVNLSSCITFDRYEGHDTEDGLNKEAQDLAKNRSLYASVIFQLPKASDSSRRRRSASDAITLPPKVLYTIRMHMDNVMRTDRVRDPFFSKETHISARTSLRYNRGFIYLQETIDRAIIDIQTNKTVTDTAVQIQPFPYPCHHRDEYLEAISFVFPLLLMIAWVLFVADFVKKLVHEREMKLHEYMKMMGVSPLSHFFAWFLESAFYLILTIFFLTLVLKYGNIMPHSDGFLLFLYLCDYGLSILAFSFLVSTFFDKTYIAALSGSLLYVFAFFPFIVVLALEARVSFSVKNLLGLFSPTAFSYASQYVSRYETQGEGIQWSNSYSSPIAGDTASFGWLCWLMLIDTFLYFIIGAYIRTVFPGKSGIPSPWYFPFTASFWKDLCSCRKANKTSRGLFLTNIMQAHPPMFPDSDAKPKGKGDLSSKASENFSDLPVGVALYGLTKMYGQQAAIENLNVAFYEGHVTSLLGHNGAGKTTTMSILTGLFPPSSGTVEVYGRDMQANLEDVRKELGVCMQYDVLFDHMTTEEHLLLYGQIKAPHWSKRELQEQVYTILEETGMFAHRHKRVGTLSGGMKRKLSISIAFIGGSRLVVLDEPTTGVDPCSRRSIWDIVIQHKKGRTIIMSTHHLDEAEVLSDRIAFLERGGLKCCGSPYSLKDQLGQGYKLTLTKKVHSGEAKKIDNAELKAFVQAHVPEARLKEAQGSDLVYLLPPFTSNNAASYRSLLTALDSNLDALQLGCYGISDTTLEEVFLHLTQGSTATAGDELPTISETVSDTDSINSYPESEGSISDDKACFTGTPTVSGVKLLWQQMTAILIKRVHHSRRDWKGLLSQILLPVLFVAFAMGLGIIKSDLRHYPKLELSPALYKIGPSYSFFSNPSSNKLAETMLSYPGLDNTCLLKPNDQVCTRSTGAWTSSNGTKKLTLCKCRDENEVCGASGYVPPHKQIPSSQVVYNVTDVNVENYLVVTAHDYIRNRYGGYDFGLPLPQNLKMDVQTVPTNRTLSKVWFNPEGHHTMPAYLSSINNFILRSNLPADKDPTEYAISVSSHPYFGRPDEEDSIVQGMLQIMVAMCIMAGFSITTASFAIYEVNEHHSGSKRLQHIAGISEPFYWIVNFFYDMATYMIPVALTVAVIAIFQVPAFTDRQNLGAVAMLLVLFGFATFPWMYLLSGMFKDAEMAFITYVCINLFLSVNTIIPTSILYFMQQITDRNSKSLTGIFQRLSDAFLIFPQFNFGNGLLAMARVNIEVQILSGYGIDAYKDPFSTEALGWMMISSFIQGVVFFSLRLLLNKYIVRKIRRLILRRKSILLGPCVDEDEDVAAEHLRVSSGAASSDVLQVNQLTKVYQHLSKKVPAVQNLSLGVPAGECFGLLGVNGAGKTTTFKMLTGDVSPTAGTAQIRDRNGRLVDIMECRNQGINIGYCPQVDALDDLLTGEEHLYFYARLHGISKREIPGVVNYLLRKVELNHYRDIIADSYSCGTRRKLSTALALVGHPQILLLDEPSSGMDPRTKRQLWKIISEEVKGKCAVVLTSHSMEECEALCGRLAIMVKGQFRCLGSLQHIKNRFGSGFMVKMYLAKASSDAEAITRFMQSRFPSTYLKEQHSAMVEYHVPTAPGGVADIFGQLESSKEFLEIQHFSVSQTTLDEVFINFAMGKIGMQTIPIDEEIEDNSALKDVGP